MFKIISLITLSVLITSNARAARRTVPAEIRLTKIEVKVMNHEMEKELSGAQVSILTKKGEMIPLFEGDEAGHYQNTFPIKNGFYTVVVMKMGFTESRFNHVKISSTHKTALSAELFAQND